jgi:membrane associated rhomboid family serine protease
MTDILPAETPKRRQPILNAPLLVIIVAVVLVLLHAAFEFAPPIEQLAISYDYALAPQRFWAPAGSPDVYPDVAAGLITLLSTGLLHADWLHVIVNSMMLLALGTPVARALGQNFVGAAAWMLLFLVSVLGGSAFYLALANVDSPYVIGASGGVSGLFAAAFLIDPRGGKHALWSRPFVGMTLAFALANAALALVGPFMLGAGISWEAHAGGYIAGALMMALLPVRGYAAARS